MLTPEQKRNIPTELVDLYADLSEYILRDIARRIAEGAKITETAEFQLYRARSLGLSTKEIAAKIAEINNTAAEVVEDLIRSAAEQSDEFDKRMLGADSDTSVPLEDNKELQKLITAQIKETNGKCENLTNTLGFADHDFMGRVYYLSMTDMYRKELDAAHMKVVTGATDYTTAIRQAVNKLAASGVRTIDYESGTSRSVEAAVRTALMTSVSHVAHSISEQNGEEFGADGWEMSAHSGARPSHAVYQGRQYTQKEYEQKIKPLLSEPNCRHDVYPIILGISEPVYTEEELQNIDPPPFTYEGKRYTAYEAQQQMRKMERDMRKQKNRCIVADASGDKEAFSTASIKLRRQKDIYEDFCKAADSFAQYERTIVGGYDRRLAGKSVHAANKAYLKEMHEYNVESPPKTLAKFNKLRYNNPKEYNKINSYISSVKNGMLSPLVGYNLYSEYHNIIETQVVGTSTSNGILITGQSKHFLERVFGTLSDPKTGTHKSGIPLENVLDALRNGTPRPQKGTKPNASQAFVLNGCLVTVNPDTGNLIQCNIYIR